MTALYAFVDATASTAAIAADNFEANNKIVVDKLRVVSQKFVVGVTGQDISMHVVSVLAEYSAIPNLSWRVPSTVSDLAHTVLSGVRALATVLHPKYMAAVKKGEISAHVWETVLKSSAHLIVLDLEALTLSTVDLGSAFPPTALLSTPTVTTLSRGTLYPFALSAKRTTATAVVSALTDAPEAYLDAEIQKDRAQYPASIGLPGACVTVVNGSVRFRSAHSSAANYLSQQANAVRGYSICVIA